MLLALPVADPHLHTLIAWLRLVAQYKRESVRQRSAGKAGFRQGMRPDMRLAQASRWRGCIRRLQ